MELNSITNGMTGQQAADVILGNDKKLEALNANATGLFKRLTLASANIAPGAFTQEGIWISSQKLAIPLPNDLTFTFNAGFRIYLWEWSNGVAGVNDLSTGWKTESPYVHAAKGPVLQIKVSRADGTLLNVSDYASVGLTITASKTVGAAPVDITAADLADAVNTLNGSINLLRSELVLKTAVTDGWGSIAHILGHITTSGTVAGDGTDANWWHSDYMAVDLGGVIDYSLSAPTNVYRIAAYDINKVFLPASSVIGGGALAGIYTVPAGVAYVRFCSSASMTNTFSGDFYLLVTKHLAAIIPQVSDLTEEVSDLTEDVSDLVGAIPINEFDTSDYIHVYTDKDGNIIAALGNDGTLSVLQLSVKNAVAGKVGYKYDVNHFVHYGQSLSQGDWETKIVSDVQKYNALMFTGTPRVWEYRDQANKYAALVPAVENVFTYRYEIDTLNITGGASANGNITVTLNGVAFVVAVLATDNTAALVAAKIRAATFAGWAVSGAGASVIFTKSALGVCSAPSVSFAATGATGAVMVTQAGEANVGATVRGETPCVGTAQYINDLMLSEDEIDAAAYNFQMLVSAPGMGGTSIGSLGNTAGAYYQRLLADVTNGKRLANASGKSYACHAVSWLQGEADSWAGATFAYYYNAMVTMFNNLNRDIKAITGQSEDVHFFLYQMRCHDTYGGYHYPNIALAQIKIALEKPNVHMATPIYHLPLYSDNVHFTAEGSKWAGGYFGRAYKRVILDGVGWKPVHLQDYYVQGNCIYLRFYAPKYPLVFDTVSVYDRGVSKGFQLREPGDTAQNSFLDIITNVEIIRPDTVKITCSSSPAGKKLTYCINGDGVHESNGNLRDSESAVFNFKPALGAPAETAHAMYNWCPLFEQILN